MEVTKSLSKVKFPNHDWRQRNLGPGGNRPVDNFWMTLPKRQGGQKVFILDPAVNRGTCSPLVTLVMSEVVFLNNSTCFNNHILANYVHWHNKCAWDPMNCMWWKRDSKTWNHILHPLQLAVVGVMAVLWHLCSCQMKAPPASWTYTAPVLIAIAASWTQMPVETVCCPNWVLTKNAMDLWNRLKIGVLSEWIGVMGMDDCIDIKIDRFKNGKVSLCCFWRKLEVEWRVNQCWPNAVEGCNDFFCKVWRPNRRAWSWEGHFIQLLVCFFVL